jgi:hypothetical protein
MAKLTIRFTADFFNQMCPRTAETIRLCLYEMNRVEKIDFTAIPGLILKDIFRDLPKSAPQLHTLRIRTYSSAFSIHDDFLYDTENLQCVELINCKISWGSRLLTGLTCLDLQNSFFLRANSSIIQVLQALQRMPALTDLHLRHSIPDDAERPFTYAVVDLPCLRVLTLSSGVGAVTAVLRHITFPNSAILNLICEGNQSIQIDFSSFFSFLATKFLSTLVVRSLSFKLVASDDNEIGFYLWTAAHIQGCFPTSQSQLQLVLKWPSSQPPSNEKALASAFDAMNLSFLTQLQIEASHHIDSQTLAKTFGKLPLLERVWVQSSKPIRFLEALVYKTKAAEKSKTAYLNVTFPKLRYIHLKHTDFFARGPMHTSVEMLLDYLMERYERNAEVRTLQLEDCWHLSSDDVKRLEEIVVDVIWDGVEIEELEEDDSDGNTIDDLDDDNDMHDDA